MMVFHEDLHDMASSTILIVYYQSQLYLSYLQRRIQQTVIQTRKTPRKGRAVGV
jgi:hypothetical protein